MDMNAFPLLHVIDRTRVFENITQVCGRCPSQYNDKGKGVLLRSQDLCTACAIAQYESKTQFRLVLNKIDLYRRWVGILKTGKHTDTHRWARLDLEARIHWLLERKSYVEAEIDRFLEVEVLCRDLEEAQKAQKMVKRLPEQKTERPKTKSEAREYAQDYLKQIGKCVDPLDEMWEIDQYQKLVNDPEYQKAMQEESRKRGYEQEQLVAEDIPKDKRVRRD